MKHTAYKQFKQAMKDLNYWKQFKTNAEDPSLYGTLVENKMTIKAYKAQDVDIQKFLWQGFSWDLAPEGHDFWRNVLHELSNKG